MVQKIAVLGAGHGGFAMSADLSMGGYEVNLYELPEFHDNLRPVIQRGGVDVVARRPPSAQEYQLPAGGKTGFAKIAGKITSDMKEAVDDVDLIMLVTPAFGREMFLRELSPCLRDGQTVVIWPAYFGALHCANLLKSELANRDVLIAETESLIYACRKTGPAEVTVFDSKRSLSVSALPSKRSGEVLKTLKMIFPPIAPARNVLETTLSNVNPILHPPSVVTNLYRVEAKFYPYCEEIGGPLCIAYDVTPGMARIMEALDKERLAVADKLGLELPSAKDNLRAFYSVSGKDLYDTILNVPAYQRQLAPTSLRARYVIEDIPYGLVPYASLGDQLDVQTPTIKALITIASAESSVDYWHEGLTMDKLGLAGMTATDIQKLVDEGTA